MTPIDPFVLKAKQPEDVARILGRCRYEEETGCLIWTGAMSDGNRPRVWVTNPATGQRTVAVGRRGVWMAMTGRAVPKGWRVFGTCNDPECLSPDHTRCGPAPLFGEHLRRSGHYQGSPVRLAANRKTGAARRKVMPADMALVHSDLTLEQVALALGVSRSTVSRYRRGEKTVTVAQTNPFMGLISR